MDNNISIDVENLNFSYPDGTKVLNDISFFVRNGERIALIGPNGAGKSTLLLQFNGILQGDGTINIEGTELNDETLTLIRRKVGIVFQDPNDQLFCPTVYDDVSFGPLHFGIPKTEINALVTKTLSDVGLNGFENKSGHHLSIGERKRVSIAAVLACRPEIILLDEPTSSLDPRHRKDMICMINSWQFTTMIATHDLDLALDTCTRCIILNHGKITADGPTQEILKNEILLKKNDLALPLRWGRSTPA